MRPGAFSTLVTTDTGGTSFVVGADNVGAPTTGTGTILAGPAVFTGRVVSNLNGGTAPSFSAGVALVAQHNGLTTDNARISIVSGSAGLGVLQFGTSANQAISGWQWDQSIMTLIAGPLSIPSSLTAGSGSVAVTDTTGKLAVFDSTHYQNLSGANFTSLNASALASGTVPSGVVSGSYTGITGVGTLTAGATGAGFTIALTTSTVTGTIPSANVSGSYTGITGVGTLTAGTWQATNVALGFGGTGATLTASNGGIFYSTGSAGAILSGTSTAGQILRSGASAAPAWSTATYPATAGSANNALVSDGTNWSSTAVVNSVAGTANQVTVSAATGAVTFSLPQSIATTSTPRFAALGINEAQNSANGVLLGVGGSVTLASGFATFVVESNATATTGGTAFMQQIAGAMATAASGTHARLAGTTYDLSFTDTGATVTAVSAIDISSFSTFAHMTNAYGLRVAAPGSGAGTVYTAQFAGTTGMNIFRSGGVSIGDTTDPGNAVLRAGNLRLSVGGFTGPGSTTPSLGSSCPASSGTANWYNIGIGFIPVFV